MKHFSEEQWTDFVRGVEGPEKEAMHAHLESGCERCRQAVQWLGELLRFGRNEASLEVPASLVSDAVAIFPPRPVSNWTSSLSELVASLLFSASPDWEPSGVRSVAANGPMVVYRAGDYLVEFSWEQLPNGSREIVGQITNETMREEVLDVVVIQLLTSDRIVAETEVGPFGEFVVEQPPGRNMTLRLGLKKHGIRIDLPLRAGRWV